METDILPANLHSAFMRRLFRNRSRVTTQASKGRIYAIGDIHGRYDLMRNLLDRIIGHWEASKKDFTKVSLVFLGDVIDRGPDVADCLKLLLNLTNQPGVVFLRGNHEDLLLKSCEGHPVAQRLWLEHGGRSTLASYGIAPPLPGEDSFDFGQRIADGIPAEIIDMIRTSRISFASDGYFFVHAGVRPGVPLKIQDEQDLLFIRDEFTSSKAWHGAVVVHGHSIVDEVEMLPNRIAVDTGAYRTGRLSCLCIQGDVREVLST